MEIKDSARTIVCYGDSNTWGRIPGGERYPRSLRWTGVLQNLLGDEYEVVNEGLSARTFVAFDAQHPERTGITHLKSILLTRKPIDAIVIMLGTNDIKSRFNLTAADIARHLEQTVNLIKGENIDKILVVCPLEIITPSSGSLRSDMIDRLNILKQLPELFKKVSEKNRCNFVNAQDYIHFSKVDGLHLDVNMHKKLAEVLKTEVLKMFS